MTTSSWPVLFQTSVDCWIKDSCLDIKNVNVFTNPANYEIDVGIVYRLFTIDELQRLHPHQIQEKLACRMHEILQTKRKTPKQISVERKCMLQRAEKAKKK